MEKKLKIRKASTDDANLIADIKTKAYRDEKERFKPDDKKIPKWFYNEWYIDIQENIRLINEYDVYILMIDEVIIGTFWVHDAGVDTVELEDFCIFPKYQGLGYGYKALTMMEGMFPKKKRWILGTPFYSIKNHYLYQKAGYKKVGMASNETVVLYEKLIV